jgi:hypothetical protein
MRTTVVPATYGPTVAVADVVGFQPTRMRCVESLSVPFSGVTSLIVAGRDPMPDADHGHR